MKVDCIKPKVNLISTYNHICNNYKDKVQAGFVTNYQKSMDREKSISTKLLDFKS